MVKRGRPRHQVVRIVDQTDTALAVDTAELSAELELDSGFVVRFIDSDD
jgi:hypothetical protein